MAEKITANAIVDWECGRDAGVVGGWIDRDGKTTLTLPDDATADDVDRARAFMASPPASCPHVVPRARLRRMADALPVAEALALLLIERRLGPLTPIELKDRLDKIGDKLIAARRD